ncbi:MAG: YdcF family protein [Propionicimonas sp.]|nr:YdcF family protein [Propionicimonas sp.]
MIFRGILVCAGVLLAGNAVWLLATTNYNAGVAIQLVLAVVVIAFGLSRRLAGSRWVAMPVVVLGGALGLVSTVLAGYGMVDNATGDEQAVVVLGAAVHGAEPSPTLMRRLDVAVDYHEENPAALIVVTGGQGPQEDLPEAEAALAYLVDAGVPDEAIVVEDRSTSTAENFAFAKTLLDERLKPGYRIVFVTNDYHVWRASRAAAAAGLDARHLHSSTRLDVIPSSYLREGAAALWSWVD